MDFAALVAAFAALVVGAYFYFFRWRKVRKSWCIILYHVSRDSNARFQWPNRSGAPTGDILDRKLDQVVAALDALPSASIATFVKGILTGHSSAPEGINWDDVHIVYRAVWNDRPIRRSNERTACAKIVTWRPSAPTYPDDTSFAASSAARNVAGDRDGFFQWAYDNCPADHYAVFFWGHSVGPGGLFELSTSVAFPPLPSDIQGVAPASLTEVQQTLDLLVALRDGQPPPPNPPPPGRASVAVGPIAAGGGNAGGGSNGGGTGAPGANAATTGAARSKIEVVLFQDCWMATLETAYELEHVARYVVGSQSLVPIGYVFNQLGKYKQPEGPIWPYAELIGGLVRNPTQYETAVVTSLEGFFNQDLANRQPSPVVTFSLLDLGQAGELSAALGPPLRNFLSALATLSKVERKLLLAGHAIVKFRNTPANVVSYSQELEAGEWALLDVLKLCVAFKDSQILSRFNLTSSSPIVLAAADLSAVVDGRAGPAGYHLVRNVFESQPPPAWVPIGFSGVSLMWIPDNWLRTPRQDGYIANQVNRSFYGGLRLVKDTEPAAGLGWDLYAFEHR